VLYTSVTVFSGLSVENINITTNRLKSRSKKYWQKTSYSNKNFKTHSSEPRKWCAHFGSRKPWPDSNWFEYVAVQDANAHQVRMTKSKRHASFKYSKQRRMQDCCFATTVLPREKRKSIGKQKFLYILWGAANQKRNLTNTLVSPLFILSPTICSDQS
jgi:hypothetical protein